ncbi:MAG: PKD domain-containing protein [Marmoricola sp.]
MAVAALALLSVPAFADDSIFFDGDFATTPGAPNISYGDAGKACATRGTPVDGAINVKYNGGNPGDPQHHFLAGEEIHVVFSTPAGVTLTLTDPTPHVPANWDDQQDEFNILFTTTVTPASAGGKVEVTLTGVDSGYDAGAGAGNGKPNFQVQINCTATPPANTAPSVAITSAATTSAEGSKTAAITFAITDPDANTWGFATGYPICGTDGTASDKTIDSTTKTGSFKCTFPDGPATRTVAVKVNDGTADSNEATIGATVTNVAPTVAQPTFGAVSSIDCRNVVTLSGISFSDPGLIDNPWAVDINWGDGSAHTAYNAASQGAQSNQTHNYTAAGSYTPTITVTDKDGGVGSATSSTTLTVNHVYQTDFLPPFDDSSPSGLIVNSMKNGRTVPVKATIFDICSNGGYVTSPAVVTVGVKKVTAPTTPPATDAVESYSDAGASSSNTNLFRWNADATSPTGGFWIYNLDSTGLKMITNSFYRIDIYVNGNQATKTDWAILQPVK